MASVNKVILLGNLGKDPELSNSATGTPFARFPLATSHRYKDSDGNQQEDTQWHNIVAWGRTAEAAATYLEKGSAAYVEGRLSTRQVESRDGSTRYYTDIVATNIQFLGARQEQPRENERRPMHHPQMHEAFDARPQQRPSAPDTGGDDLPF